MTMPTSNKNAALIPANARHTPTEWLRHQLDCYREATASAIDSRTVRQAAVVFAPHYDDETLGCGGLIIRKRLAGAECRIVFMTDGGASHGDRFDRASLAEARRLEAVSAGRVMGIAAHDIHTLAYPDQMLRAYAEDAADRIAELLIRVKPEQIWYPHVSEPLIWSSDHAATTAIVREAARRCGRTIEMFEYPVWLWFGYPWIDPTAAQPGERRAYLRASISGAFGLRLARGFGLTHNISDLLEVKRSALAEYRSQTGGIAHSPSLATVAKGQFLDRLLRPTEIYARGSPLAPRTR